MLVEELQQAEGDTVPRLYVRSDHGEIPFIDLGNTGMEWV